MIDRDDLFRRFTNANPVPNEEGLPNWLSDSRPPLTLLIRESRSIESGTPIVEFPPPRDPLLFDEGSDMETMERKEVIETRRPVRWGAAVAAFAAVIVLVVGAIGIGILMSGDDEVAAPTPHEIATARVGSFFAAWNVYDGQAVATLFTEEGVYEDPSPTGTFVGRDAIASAVESDDGRAVSNGQLTGELVPTGEGTFAFSFEFANRGEPWIGEAQVTIDGDLISRLEIFRWESKE
ncbi:MAG: nuclear transport factor 2 family protein [Acidimicrobiia bacterium]|nr:nuclear transport factor 2 family protein [Acidimicrobiia bacterium]